MPKKPGKNKSPRTIESAIEYYDALIERQQNYANLFLSLAIIVLVLGFLTLILVRVSQASTLSGEYANLIKDIRTHEQEYASTDPVYLHKMEKEDNLNLKSATVQRFFLLRELLKAEKALLGTFPTNIKMESTPQASWHTYLSYLAVVVVFGIMIALYRYHANQVAKLELWKLSFIRLNILTQLPRSAALVRGALGNDLFISDERQPPGSLQLEVLSGLLDNLVKRAKKNKT